MIVKQGYCFTKISEGGWLSQKEAVRIAKELGADRAYIGHCPYIGQFAVYLEAHKYVHRKFEKEVR